MTEHLDKNTRQKIIRFLPIAIIRALRTYNQFSKKAPENHADEDFYKDFKSHQEGCKASLAHTQLLLNLAEEILKHGPKNADTQYLQFIVDNANAEIVQNRSLENEDGDA